MNPISKNSLARGISLPLLVVLALAGCSSNEKKNPPSSQPTTASPSPSQPPSYSAEKIRSSLLADNEIGKDVREIPPTVAPLKDKKAPTCSLTGIKIPNDPDVTTRQFTNSRQVKGEVKYAQLIARYETAEAANTAYEQISRAAQKCPKKNHVPAKRVRKNFIIFAHDDTWKVVKEPVANWTTLRGVERQRFSNSSTTFNVFHMIYDYAVRGNVVVTSVYWERTEEGKSNEPISKRAAELLTKQLQKFG